MIAFLFLTFVFIGIPAYYVWYLFFVAKHSAHGQRERMIKALERRG